MQRNGTAKIVQCKKNVLAKYVPCQKTALLKNMLKNHFNVLLVLHMKNIGAKQSFPHQVNGLVVRSNNKSRCYFGELLSFDAK